MKNKVKQRSFAILTLLLSSATGSMGTDVQTVTGIPGNLTLSQMPKEGCNLWTNSIIAASAETPAEAAQTKLVNRNSLIKEAAHYAQDAYDLYTEHKVGNVSALPAGATPFYFGGEAEGFVSYEPGQNGQKGKIVVAFRGTKEGWDWGTNLNGAFGDMAYIYGSTGKVHHGFHQRYKNVRGDIHAAICKLQGQYGIDSDIHVTGHSLGGASASLAAADIKQNIQSNGKLKLVTFNSPRVFDAQSADDVTKLIGVANMIRLWREKDPVSMVGMGILGYKHVGTEMKLEETDSSYLMNWEKKAVPNHAHSANIADVNGNKIILPQEHKGKMTQISEQAPRVYNVVTEEAGQLYKTVESKITAGYNYLVKPVVDNVFAPVVNAVNDYVIAPVVNAVSNIPEQVARAQNIVTEETGRIYSDAERKVSNAYNAVADAASNTNKAFWGYLGY